MIDAQGVGIGWACTVSNHGNCQQAGCRCPCHYSKPTQREVREIVKTPIEKIANPSIEADLHHSSPSTSYPIDTTSVRCPKCGTPAARAGDKFCRKDGTRLESPHCGACGAEVLAEDQYCAGCGQPVGPEAPVIASPTTTATQ